MKKFYDIKLYSVLRRRMNYDGENEKLRGRIEDWKLNDHAEDIVVSLEKEKMIEFLSHTTCDGERVNEMIFKHVLGEDYDGEEKDAAAGTQG